MKKILLFGFSFILGISTYSQIFSDNFDSYTAGDYLCLSNPVWDTWSGGSGTSEDVKISPLDFMSAPNSLHFQSSSANGGPQDVILRFEDVYTTGNFTLDFNMKVVANKGAYFNLQQNHNVGEVWALQCYLLNTGAIKFDNGSSGEIMLEGSYPNGEWFNLRLEIDLTTNIWEVFINNNSIGQFSNAINSIGIWDIFPVNPASLGGNGQSEFFVDDVSYNHLPATLPQLNAGVTYVAPINGLEGQTLGVSTKVRNLGEDNITSFDITYEYGSQSVTETKSGINLASLGILNYNFDAPAELISGSNTLTVTVSNVNGEGQDDEPGDDSKSITILPIQPAPGKVVVGEEATGTWCVWCPRGAVFMEMMAEKYEGYWAGIAVHNGDPMAVQHYDSVFSIQIGNAYPSGKVDRGTTIDPSQFEDDFITQITKEPKAVITNGATFDPQTRELKVSLTYDFNSSISGNWKVACVLTEDGVTGTGSGYNQANAYAGGSNGEMGGYETLPNPVPASQMVYNSVARDIKPAYGGGTGILPTSVAAGEQHTACFTFTLPASWDESKMHIIGLLISTNGKIDNAGYTTIADAVSNGLVECDGDDLGVNEEHLNVDFTLYPNPSNGMAFVRLTNVQGEKVSIIITDLTGKVVAEKGYELQVNTELPINTNTLSNGTYIVKVVRNGVVQQKKLIVSK